jgi:transcription antitermination factor NusG
VTKDETKLNVDRRIVREDLARGKFKDAENQVKKVDNDRQELNEDQHSGAKEVTKDETKLNVDRRVVREDLARGKFKDAENQVKKVDNDKQELNEDQQ